MKTKTTNIRYRVDLEACAQLFLQRGYHIYEKSESKLVLFKAGSVFAMSVKRLPLELSVECSGRGASVSLSYGTWVLFDTGDLERELARLVKVIESQVGEQEA